MGFKHETLDLPDITKIEAAITAGNSAAVIAMFQQQQKVSEQLREELEEACRERDEKHAAELSEEIARRKRYEDELRKRETEYCTLTENLSDGIIRLDRDFRIIYANPAVAEVMQSSRDELLGKTPIEFPVPLHIASLWYGGVKRVLSSGQKEVFEYEFDDLRFVHCLQISMIPEFGPDGAVESVLAITRDISEQKKTVVLLRESEERFRLALGTSPITVYSQDGNLRYTWVYSTNPKLPAELFLGRTDHDIYPAEEAGRMSNLKLQVLHTGQQMHVESAVLIPSGKIWLEITIATLRNNEGQIIGLTGVALDITERKRAEDALRESESRVRMKLDTILSPQGDISAVDLADIIDVQAIQSLMDDLYALAHIPMSIIDLKGNVLVGVGWQKVCIEFHRANPETCKHCVESDTLLSAGISPGEYRLYKCKNNMWDMATPIMVGEQLVGNLFMGQFFFENEPPDYDFFRSQARQYGFDEKVYLAALDSVPRLSRVSVDTGMAFFLKFSTMVSKLSYSNLKLARTLAERDHLLEALRESEEDLTRAQVVAQTGSWRLYTRQDELRWSAETYRIFGIPPGTSMTYEAFLTSIHPDDREYVDRKWTAAMQGEPYDIEHRIIIDDTVKWVRERAELEFNPDGRLRSGFGTVQDITERKALEQKVAQLSREQETFIRHEMKNLVTPMQLFAEMLLQDTEGLTGEQVHSLQRIAETAERAVEFIDSLKQIHDIENGVYTLKRVRYPLETILWNVVRNLKPLAEKGGVTIRFISKENNALIPVDIQLLPGVFTNLILNAVEHVAGLEDPGEKVVTVELSRELDQYVIRINNRGIPIPPERLALFFDKYNVGKEKRHGTGLGTTYALLVTKAHNGEITVTSNAEEGTTVTLQFPIEH